MMSFFPISRGLSIHVACLVSATSLWSQTEVKVVLMAGQSNMQGYAKASGLPANLQAPNSEILYYDGSADSKTRNTLMPLQPNSTSSGTYFGPEITLGSTLLAANPDTTYALIKYGDAGKNLHTQFRAPYPGDLDGGTNYLAMRLTFDTALQALVAAGYTPEIIGMVWLQGESDASTLAGAEAYDENLTDFVSDMRSHYGEDLPFVIGGIGYTTAAYRDTVMAGQMSVADAMPNVSYFDNDDINSAVPYNHLLHFETPQMQIIGQRYATELLAIPEPSITASLGFAGIVLLIRVRKRSKHR